MPDDGWFKMLNFYWFYRFLISFHVTCLLTKLIFLLCILMGQKIQIQLEKVLVIKGEIPYWVVDHHYRTYLPFKIKKVKNIKKRRRKQFITISMEDDTNYSFFDKMYILQVMIQFLSACNITNNCKTKWIFSFALVILNFGDQKTTVHG